MAFLEPCKPIYWWFIEETILVLMVRNVTKSISIEEVFCITMNNEMNMMLNILTLVWWEQGVIWAYQLEYSLPVQLCSIVQLCHIPLCSRCDWHWLTNSYSRATTVTITDHGASEPIRCVTRPVPAQWPAPLTHHTSSKRILSIKCDVMWISGDHDMLVEYFYRSRCLLTCPFPRTFAGLVIFQVMEF